MIMKILVLALLGLLLVVASGEPTATSSTKFSNGFQPTPLQQAKMDLRTTRRLYNTIGTTLRQMIPTNPKHNAVCSIQDMYAELIKGVITDELID